jgi:hypothetical protein
MWQVPVRLRNDVLALQSTAERAGLALACPFASSAEFEAAVIASKRRAGVYGPKRHLRYLIYAVYATAAVAMVVAIHLLIA